ncbi:7,8-didemethyl-8-hydroxy-5-deazariboflavin synthase subunit 1 [Richelia intracellularis HM01]|nr:7,8-didemethyl-8-hydroxy-5-deazariboflavin synthase subunit 1 [Richelia intracellularis HM01]
MGFLPHTNVGILSFAEMQRLKQVNVSMGLMLEQITPKLVQTVHRNAPSKLPSLRLEQLKWAGELQIPFTTGLLLGIGEVEDDCWDALKVLAKLHKKYGHIQEVILQPYSQGNKQTWQGDTFNPYKLPEIIHCSRQILPPDITIQIPPNLVRDNGWLIACLEAGAGDFGGISLKDEVNPDYPQIRVEELRKILQLSGWNLIPRLPVYPQFINWLVPNLQVAVSNWQKFISVTQ